VDRVTSGDSRFYKTSGWDLLLMGSIILFSVISILGVIRHRNQRPGGEKAVLIYQNQRLIEEVSLEKDKAVFLEKGNMQIEIKAQRVRVVRSVCPQHVCMNMGWIKYSGQTIVCVPNQVLIEIKSTEPAVIDAVSY